MSAHATPRIVVLDGYTLTAAQPGEQPANGEPDWAALEALGELTVYPRTADAMIVEHARAAQIVLTNKTPLTAQTINALDQLQYIGVLATGTNVVDLEAARQHGITVTNVPGYSTASVAQHVFALLLELTNHVALHSEAVHHQRWTTCDDFSFTLAPLTELAGKTLGIVGFGAIGQQVARIGHALGMNIAVHSRTRREFEFPVQWMEVDELFEASDVISLHCPLTEQTQHLVNRDRLKRMKSTALLINTGRGPLIDEAALADALANREIAGAGLDVVSEEPPTQDNPLLGAPHCYITPHNAWASQEARQRLMAAVADNVKAFLKGAPTNVVN